VIDFIVGMQESSLYYAVGMHEFEFVIVRMLH